MRSMITLLAIIFGLSMSSICYGQESQNWEILTLWKFSNQSKDMSGIYIFEEGKDPIRIPLKYGDPVSMGETQNKTISDLYAFGWELVECFSWVNSVECVFKRKK